MATATQDREWLDGAKAARVLGVPDYRNVRTLAQRGMIRTRDLPGVRSKYRREDVEQIARSAAGESRG